MKNLRKSYIAIAAASVLGMNVQAGTLQESLSGGKVSGEIRSVTVLSSKSDETEAGPYNNAKSSAIALQLKYNTADYKGFKAEVGFQTAHSFDLEETNAAADAPNFYNERESRVTQEGSNLFLANVSYNTGNTEVKVGRQTISTTLMSISNANPLVDTFHGLSVVNKDISNTEVKFFVLKDWYESQEYNFLRHIPQQETTIRQIASKVLQEIKDSSKDKDSYGLIHGDIWLENTLVTEDNRITIIDFQDCEYNYYLYDLAVPIYSALEFSFMGNGDIKRYKEEITNAIITGYQEEHPVPTDFFDNLPLFLKLKELFEYSQMHAYWNGNSFTEEQVRILNLYRMKLESDLSYS